MAKQINFKPRAHDPLDDVRRKLDNITTEHAAAIVSLYELLQEAENHGVLDLLRGSIQAGEHITGKLAEYANTPAGINAFRNLLIMGKLLGTINPELLNSGVNDLAVDMSREVESHRNHPPSIWQTMKKAFSGDALRGLSLMVSALASMGKTLGKH